MGLGDRVVLVAGELLAANDVLVPGANLVAGVDLEHGVGGVAGLAADHVLAGHVLHGVVVVGGPQRGQRALVGAVDGHLLEDGVALDRDGRCQERREDGELHGGRFSCCVGGRKVWLLEWWW